MRFSGLTCLLAVLSSAAWGLEVTLTVEEPAGVERKGEVVSGGIPLPEGACLLYPGDAGYEASETGRAGPRHRLWMLPDGWRYERS